MGTVVATMLVIMVVGGGVLLAAAWLHHLAGSVESQARVRRWRFQMLWHVYRMRLRTGSWARAARRGLATRMGPSGDGRRAVDDSSGVTTGDGATTRDGATTQDGVTARGRAGAQRQSLGLR